MSGKLKSAYELNDVASVVFYCDADNTMLLVPDNNSTELWIPSVQLTKSCSSVAVITKNIIQEIFGVVIALNKLLRIHKVWLSSSQTVTHTIFEIHVQNDVKKKSKNLSGKFKGRLRWCTLEDIVKLHNANVLKSPEILEFIALERNLNSSITNVPSEYVTVGNYMEINRSVFVTQYNTIYEKIVEAAGIVESFQEILYQEFFFICFPAMYLSLEAFAKFAMGIGWSKDTIPDLFSSADLYNRGGISFREFLYFLAVTEPGIIHGGSLAELRARYIFKYLDSDKDNALNYYEMRNFVILLRKAKRQSLDSKIVNKELNEFCVSIGNPEQRPITKSEFLRAVSELKIRGTSQVFRAPFCIQKVIKKLSQRDTRVKAQVSTDQIQKTAKNKFFTNKDYEVAMHSIKVQKSGTTINVDKFWNVENALSVTTTRISTDVKQYRQDSTENFDQQSKSNELLKALRYLLDLNKSINCYSRIENLQYLWGHLQPVIVSKHLMAVCDELKIICREEPRLLNIQSPVYIMGDLHGNCTDLIHLEKIFWHVGPGLSPCNLLFLGDYVDRGVFSFEVICYLFAYKLQSPKKVFLLRGNHEIKLVQQQHTFEKEIKAKFGDKLGITIFDIINDVFDTLPIAAVVDGKVFCCHGGIPPPWLCPIASAINDIPSVLKDPLEQSSLAWEIMWNDPIKIKHLSDKITLELTTNEGFAVNNRRGTAHFFSAEALEKFLSANGYTHLIRAHEVVEAGFFVQHRGQTITVFSSSKYCGGSNLAACLLVDQGKIRILQVETNHNYEMY